MPTDKGYVTQKKRDDRKAEFVTMSPVGENKHALDIALKGTVYKEDSDLVEAGSTSLIINATAHNAKAGDLIRFTSGAASNEEAYVFETTNDTITLYDNLSAAPSAGDGFDVLRAVTATLAENGSFAGNLTFIKDSNSVEVTEDTVTPANNIPLPVKLTSVTGDINITANDLNVQTSHNAANPDSSQIGDGVEIMQINASGEAQVADDTARTSLANIDADTTTIAADTTSLDTKIDVNLSTRASEATQVLAEAHLGNIDAATASIDTDIDVALSTRASEATQVLAEAHLGNIDTATASIDTDIDVALSTRASESTLSTLNGKITTCDTSNVTVASSVLPTGAATSALQNSLLTELQAKADLTETQPVSVASLPLPTGAATEATLSTIDADTSVIAAWDTNTGAVGANTQRVHLTDESLAALENITVVIDPLTVVDTTYTDASSSNIPGNATAPLQLIASTSSDIKKLQFADTTGTFLEIMTGAAASEVRVALVGPGSDSTLELDITSGTRVSVRSVESASAVTVGSLAINYIG